MKSIKQTVEELEELGFVVSGVNENATGTETAFVLRHEVFGDMLACIPISYLEKDTNSIAEAIFLYLIDIRAMYGIDVAVEEVYKENG